MKNTNPIFSLKNFRSFGEDGADFELAPITVLTGCNSAGKSSLVKALILLSEQAVGGKLGKGYSNIERLQPDSALKTFSHELRLGGFKNVINEQSKDGILTFSYRIWSNYLQEEIVCRRVYCAKNNVLNEGKLLEFTIEKLDGTIIYKTVPEYYLEALNIADEFQECEFESMSDDDNYFESIENNYNRFILACKYVDLYNKINNLQTIIPRRKDAAENQLDKYKKEFEQINKQLGSILPNDYDDQIIQQWNQRWNSPFKAHSEIDKMYLTTRSNEEKIKDDQYDFYSLIINEAVSPWFIKNKKLISIDSTTNEIRRVYNIENDDKLSKLLNLLIEKQTSATYQTKAFVNKWLKLFGIGDSIEIVGMEEGLGVKVYVKKNDTKRLLADEGYGITQLVSILLQIELSININSHYDPMNDKFNVTKYTISIEEPEIHLHPKHQSLLADMFVEAYQKYNISFIIETHSEYLIRKLQVLVADKESTITSSDISLNYVEKNADGVSTNRKIGVTKDGRLMDCFGEGFFDEAGGLSRQLLKLSL